MWQERVGLYFAMLRNFYEFLKDVWNRTKIATVAGRCATNLAAHIVETSSAMANRSRYNDRQKTFLSHCAHQMLTINVSYQIQHDTESPIRSKTLQSSFKSLWAAQSVQYWAYSTFSIQPSQPSHDTDQLSSTHYNFSPPSMWRGGGVWEKGGGYGEGKKGNGDGRSIDHVN